MDLGAQTEWVPLGQLSELTPRLARAYANKTAKTVQRDLTALAGMNLIVRGSRRVRARREVIFAFLPLRRTSAE